MKIILKKTSKNDLKFFYVVRNNNSIRSKFFNTKKILLDEHHAWFLNKLSNKKNIYFTIFLKNKKIGIIRYDRKDFYYEISISILPHFQLNNIGSLALSQSEKLLKNYMIISKIKLKNKRSKKFFIKNNYNILKDDKEIILYKIIKQNKDTKDKKLIDKIQNIRKRNNVNWMDILRISFEKYPDQTKNIFKKIFNDDKSINKISRKLFS